MENVRKVLVPVDFSDTSDNAIKAAIGVARKYGAELVVLHVYTIPVYSFPDGAYVSPANLAVEISSAAQRGLDALAARLDREGVKATALLREGRAEDEIPAVAKELGADLIVVGTHARRGLARALLGSVAETVIRTCDTPVLVVHPPHAPK